MIRLRHKCCKSEVIRYTGVTPLADNPIMLSSEWVKPNGTHPVAGSELVVVCPDCRLYVMIHPSQLEPMGDNEKVVETEIAA